MGGKHHIALILSVPTGVNWSFRPQAPVNWREGLDNRISSGSVIS